MWTSDPGWNGHRWLSRHEPWIATGTTGSWSAAASKALAPARLNEPRLPSFDRVPSGKITADRFRAWTRLPSPAISSRAWPASPRSIRAWPPCFRLSDTDGIQRPNSDLATYLGRFENIRPPISTMS